MYKKVKHFLPFREARTIVRSLKLKNVFDYYEYCAGRTHWGKRDPRVPTDPAGKYKDSGWINWGDWLGVDNSLYRYKNYLPFIKARKIIRSLGLKNKKEWFLFRNALKKGNRYSGLISLLPQDYYKNRGWKNWSDWLGIEISMRHSFLSYKDARKFAQTLGLNSTDEWRYYPKDQLPPGIPRCPESVYKTRNEWISWGDFLGTGNMSFIKRQKKTIRSVHDV